VGLGLSAFGAGAVALWPPIDSVFDPAKALAFAVPFGAWLFAELFSAPIEKAVSEKDVPDELLPHDIALAERLFAKADGEFVRFLKDHHFGASWHRSKTRPAFDLEDLLGDPNCVFEDQQLEAGLAVVRTKTDDFVEVIATYGGPIRGHTDLFDMIPYREKERGEQSARTEQRIDAANGAADELASALTGMFSLFRKRGMSLVREELPVIEYSGALPRS